MSIEDIRQKCDQVLIDSMTPKMKQSIVNLLAGQVTPDQIISMVTDWARLGGGNHASAVVLGTRAYLVSLGQPGRDDR